MSLMFTVARLIGVHGDKIENCHGRKMDSKSGREGTKTGNGTQKTNGFIHNVILQHVSCVIRQSMEIAFMVIVCRRRKSYPTRASIASW